MKKLLAVSLLAVCFAAQNVWASVVVDGATSSLGYEHWLPKKAYIVFNYDSQNKLSGYRLIFQAEDGELFSSWKMRNSDGNTANFPFILESTLVIDNKGEVEKTDRWGFGRLDGNNSETPPAYVDSTFSDLSTDNYGIGIMDPSKLKENVLYDYWFELKEATDWFSADPQTLQATLRFRLNIDLSAAKKFGYSKDEIERDFELGYLWGGVLTEPYGYDRVDVSINYSIQYIGEYFSFAIEKYEPSDKKTYSDYFVLSGMEGRWCKSRDENPRRVNSIEECFNIDLGDSDDGQVAGVATENPLVGSVTLDPSTSSSKPNLFVKTIELQDGKTKYYHDETIETTVKVKNSGTSVNPSITEISVKLYRSKGENIDTDPKNWSENIKGENLESGDTKAEYFEYNAPDEEDRYDEWACVDIANTVSESNENDNCSGLISFRVHTRPNLKMTGLTLDGGKTQFTKGENPYARGAVTNTGGEPFEDVKMKFYVDNSFIGEGNMRHYNLERNDVKNESVYVFTANMTIGNHTLTACTNFSEDQDQSDNCRSLVFVLIDSPSLVFPISPTGLRVAE